MKLPESFLNNMRSLLGSEYEEWLASFSEPAAQGLRINTGKLERSVWEERLCPFETKRVPWTENGYYYGEGERPSRHPYYAAGLYYLQEPSAMTPAAMLPVTPGDRVLDLCAAPGGKSTELGARLRGKGLLVANDISNSRAKALLKNLELSGIPNLCVTSEPPEKLTASFGEYFDKILVDAPCSGEGMFRKDPELIKSWEERGPEYYAGIQREILTQAAAMLLTGGYLMYSTCTFSPVEDEENVAWLLRTFPEMELCTLPLFDGASRGINGEPILRLFPHKVRGEGHFLALFRKTAGSSSMQKDGGQTGGRQTADRTNCGAGVIRETDFSAFEELLSRRFDRERLMVKQDLIYYLPEGFDSGKKLRYLRTGLLLGEQKRGRFEPSQALAMALKNGGFSNTVSFSREDERVIRYLKGETVFLTEQESVGKGWCLVCVDGFPLGWAKYAAGTLKNKYYPGWRWQ